MRTQLRTGWRILKRTASGFSDDELMTRAAALAFYSVMSFAPLLVLLIWIAASLGGAWQARIVSSLNGLLGPRASEAVHLVLANADARPGIGNWAGLIGLAVTLISASAVFAQLQNSINHVWGLRASPRHAWLGWLRTRMHALGLIASIGFLMVVSLAASALIAVFVPGDSLLWRVLEAAISFAIFIFVFAGMFKVLPDARIDWSDALHGALLTAILFTAGKFAIGIYLDHSKVGGAYGSAGGIVVLLVWVYYSSLILLLGAELTEALANARGSPIQPSSHATLLNPATMAFAPNANSAPDPDDRVPAAIDT
ncbi:MAG: YihY/virulence factor BrkB family protein [Rhodanobacteraceae bacterium]